MPYVAAGSILNIMRYAFPDGLEEAVIATVMREVLKGLAYVHARGGIHRDVKAGNILVAADGSVVLADFGVAATMERSGSWGSALASRSTFVGTPCWMAPEVMEQAAGYDSLADVWSFGITLLELAHGHAPFARFPPMKVLLMTIQNPPPTLDSADGGGRKHFSKAMRDIVAKCLVKDPSRRPTAASLLEHKFFKTAHDAGYLVKHLVAGLPSVAVRTAELREGRGGARRAPAPGGGGVPEMSEAAADAASQAAYVAGVSAWNFDLPALRAAAAAEGASGLDPVAEGVEPGTPTDDLSRAGSRAADPFAGADPFAAAAAASPFAAPPGAKPAAKRQGRFEVYEGDDPPPPAGAPAPLARPPSASAPAEPSAGPGSPGDPSPAAPTGGRKAGRFQIVHDDFGEPRPGPRPPLAGAAPVPGLATDRASGAGHDSGAPSPTGPALASLLPPLKDMLDSMAGQVDLLKELVSALHDVGRGKPKNLASLLDEVALRAAARPSVEEADRLRREVASLKGEGARLRERLRVAEDEVERSRRPRE